MLVYKHLFESLPLLLLDIPRSGSDGNSFFFGCAAQHAGILVPHPGMEPVPGVLTTGLPGKSLPDIFILLNTIVNRIVVLISF